jgi:hypothetical protein
VSVIVPPLSVACLSTRYRERVRARDELEGGGGDVGLELLDVLAAGDHGADGRVPERPGERPLRERHAGRHLVGLDLRDGFELRLDLMRIMV